MGLLESFAAGVVAFVKAHQAWAPFIVAGLCFAESLAVVSFFVPATVILIGIGGLIGSAGLNFWPIWWGAVIGGILGDWLSYVVGLYFKESAHHHWPLSRYPDFTKRADDFMRKWGAMGVFIGRFSGPLRAFVPLAAGIFGVPQWKFQLANVTSAIVWGFVLLGPGWGITTVIRERFPGIHEFIVKWL
jgi:membrane protein DedA with SNARE-associated domain